MPDRVTLWRWRNEKPEFAAALARAREANAETIEDQISDIEQKRQEYDLWKSLYGEELAIVLSRDPVDVIRMSDHPKAVQAIESCHSEGSGYFDCAVEEAEEGGMIAYMVRKSDIEDKDLDEGELFEDQDRGVKGIKPYARLRLRRFERPGRKPPKSEYDPYEEGHTPENSPYYDLEDDEKWGGDVEVAVPELRTYGASLPNLVDVVTSWAREAQPEFYRGDKEYPTRASDWRITGGGYRDNPSAELFRNFFSSSDRTDADESTDAHGRQPSSEREVHPWRMTDRMPAFWTWMTQTYKQVPNPNTSEGAQKYIAPSTLRGYARGATSYSGRARALVRSYMEEYKKVTKTARSWVERKVKTIGSV